MTVPCCSFFSTVCHSGVTVLGVSGLAAAGLSSFGFSSAGFSFSSANSSSSVLGPSVTSGEPWSSPTLGASKSRPSFSFAVARAVAKSVGKFAVEPDCTLSARTGLVPKNAAPIITEATPNENFRILYLQRFSNNPLFINF